MGRKSKKEEIYVYIQLITLLYSRNQHNSVKQLYSKKKLRKRWAWWFDTGNSVEVFIILFSKWPLIISDPYQ